MPFGLNRDASLADLPHGSYRAFIKPPYPVSIFERYEGHWRYDGRLYSITATSIIINSPDLAERIYQQVLEVIDSQFGYVFRSFERVGSSKLWEAVRLGPYRRMVTWSGEQERDVDMQGYLCIIANLLAEPPDAFRIEVSFHYDLESSAKIRSILRFDGINIAGDGPYERQILIDDGKIEEEDNPKRPQRKTLLNRISGFYSVMPNAVFHRRESCEVHMGIRAARVPRARPAPVDAAQSTVRGR